MLVSLLDISLLLYFQMFTLENFVGTFTFPRPSMGICLDVYTCKFCWQICFPSSLCGLMLGQYLYLQILLANLLSFILMWTYAWIAFILANFVGKFAFLRPYADLCLDSIYTCKFCQQICFPSSLCGLMLGQLLYLQILLANLLSFVLIPMRTTYIHLGILSSFIVEDNVHPFRNLIVLMWARTTYVH